MQNKISKRVVDAIKPTERDQFVWDTDLAGFGLKVTPKGRCMYIFQGRIQGSLRRWTIGEHGKPYTIANIEQRNGRGEEKLETRILTADLSRREAQFYSGMVHKGIDPQRKASRVSTRLTVAELCDEWIERGCRDKKASTIAMDCSRIKRHVKPLLGRMSIQDITRADIKKLMADIEDGKTAGDEKTGARGRAIVTGGKAVAARTVGMLGAMFKYAIEQDYLEDTPVRNIKRSPDTKRDRFLSSQELARLGEALNEEEMKGSNQYAIAAIRALMLTGCRKNEILSLRWDWIDWEVSVLRLPDSKTGAKIVPIGAPALELFSNLPRLNDCPFVFPGANKENHLIGLQKIWAGIRERARLADVRLHDLRHSFASVAASGGDSLLIIGALLGHKTASSTSRYAHLANDPVKAAADKISGQIAASLKIEGR